MASHASLSLINCKQQSNESLTAFIFQWSELSLESHGTSADQCIDKLKIHLFSSQVISEKMARYVIKKHPKLIVHAFRIAKEEEKNY